MATIVPRTGLTGKRTWQAQVRKKGYPRQTKTFDRKTDATKWARMIERQMDEQTWRNLNGAESLLMSNALDRYLNEVKPSAFWPEKQHFYRNSIRFQALAYLSLHRPY